MGEMVEFASNGGTGTGYLAVPASRTGPGLVVIQEWWGLVPHIKDVVDRLAGEGFVALAPDLYRGAKTTEPDEAGKLMMALNLAQAAQDMSGAVEAVAERSTGEGVGVIGFCMGGGLALMLATQRPDKVKAVTPFYGLIPWESAHPDWSKLQAAVRGHYAADDGMFPPDQVAALEERLKGLGKEASMVVHPGVDHAFFNDTRPEVYDAEQAGAAWEDALAFFRRELAAA